MADPHFVAIETERALKRIVEAVPRLAARLSIDPVDVPIWGRDLNYLHMEQMQAIADNLDQMLIATDVPEAEDLNSLTKAQLVERLEALGVTGVDKDAHKKDDLIGMVERQQALIEQSALDGIDGEETPEESKTDGSDPAHQ